MTSAWTPESRRRRQGTRGSAATDEASGTTTRMSQSLSGLASPERDSRKVEFARGSTHGVLERARDELWAWQLPLAAARLGRGVSGERTTLLRLIEAEVAE